MKEKQEKEVMKEQKKKVEDRNKILAMQKVLILHDFKGFIKEIRINLKRK